mmetsp:Transcript_63790/g.138756  ORF Transcript_63790/g.138756 Transcript_63790/m.138756 type:complete len:230 (+) Transcript_63790:338-1027(+)
MAWKASTTALTSAPERRVSTPWPTTGAAVSARGSVLPRYPATKPHVTEPSTPGTSTPDAVVVSPPGVMATPPSSTVAVSLLVAPADVSALDTSVCSRKLCAAERVWKCMTRWRAECPSSISLIVTQLMAVRLFPATATISLSAVSTVAASSGERDTSRPAATWTATASPPRNNGGRAPGKPRRMAPPPSISRQQRSGMDATGVLASAAGWTLRAVMEVKVPREVSSEIT